MFKKVVGISVSFLLTASCVMADDVDVNVRVKALHERLITIDSHVDIPWNYATSLIDASGQTRLQVDIPKMDKGGLDAAFFIVYVDQSYRNDWEYDAVKKAAMTKFKAIHRMVKGAPDEIGLAYSSADVQAIVKSNRKVALIGVENGFAIGKDIGLLKTYYDLGMRYMTLVHNGHNDIGDSAQPQKRFNDKAEEHKGLSIFGKKVIAEMNRLGVMVDVSHVSRQTMIDATLLSKSPVIASHSSAMGVTEHVRNLDDEQLLLIKNNGGVVQVTAIDPYLKDQSSKRDDEIEAIKKELGITAEHLEFIINQKTYDEFRSRVKNEVDVKYPRATVKNLVDHIDYIVKKIGINYVGISSDFDGGGGIAGWNDASESENLTRELLERGYSEGDIAKIWGGNLLRVLEENEKISKSMN